MLTKNVLILIVILSFSFAHILNYLSYLTRISGNYIGYPLVGTSLSRIIEGGSFACLLFFLPSISYLVDRSLINIKLLIILFIVCFVFTLISMTLIFFIKNKIIEIFAKILITHIEAKRNILISFLYFMKVDFKYNNHKLDEYKFFIHKKVFIISVIAYCAISSGFMISYSLAIHFTEFRLTISSLAMYIHAVGQILLLLFIDPKLNSSIDKMIIKNSKNLGVINTFFISRIISLILLTLISLTLVLFI